MKHNPVLGFFYTFLCATFSVLTSVIVKKLSYIDPGQISTIRSFGMVAGILPLAVFCHSNILGEKKDRGLLILRGILGATVSYLNLTAYGYLPLAEAAIILSTGPALTAFIARIFLKEPCGLIQSLSLVITTCGVLASVRLPELLKQSDAINRFDYLYIGGLAAAVGCVVTLSFTYVALRKLKSAHFTVPIFYCGFIGVVENGIISVASSTITTPMCGWDQTLYLTAPLLGFLVNFTFTLALQVEGAGIVSAVRCSLEIVIAIVFQTTLFKQSLDVYNITGACLVLAAVSMIGIRNWLLMLPEESKTRNTLKYLLL